MPVALITIFAAGEEKNLHYWRCKLNDTQGSRFSVSLNSGLIQAEYSAFMNSLQMDQVPAFSQTYMSEQRDRGEKTLLSISKWLVSLPTSDGWRDICTDQKIFCASGLDKGKRDEAKHLNWVQQQQGWTSGRVFMGMQKLEGIWVVDACQSRKQPVFLKQHRVSVHRRVQISITKR